MNKKVISALLCGAMVLGCAAPVMAADKAGDGQKIALVGKSAGNADPRGRTSDTQGRISGSYHAADRRGRQDC